MALNCRVLVSLIALVSADACRAQLAASPPSATSDVPDAAPGTSLGTTVSTVGPVTTIDDGTDAGFNLFHSFSTFDLANLSLLDASGVLRGQSGAVMGPGTISQINMMPVGPYGAAPAIATELPAMAATVGGCQ